eukprot:GHVR01041810.1.p1 GENE.GHVR01041810.1~~GHVR01041810.1.p1  ORF type:complete len:195 (+),score=6.76 GHVR01041810.1:475-1059(+)
MLRSKPTKDISLLWKNKFYYCSWSQCKPNIILPADVTALAPYRYFELVVSAIIAYIVFNEIPTEATIWGALIIIPSTLFIVYSGKKGVEKKRFRLEAKKSVVSANMNKRRLILTSGVANTCLIMHYLPFHKSQKTLELIKSVGCKIIFLPPYSPDLNPIEKFWANMKRWIKDKISDYTQLYDAIREFFSAPNTR